MTKVEEVARAIYGATPFKETAGGYDEQSDTYKRMCMLLARAAIEAMRKPSRPMIRAAAAAMSPGKRPTDKYVSCNAKHAIRYRAMIDAALSDHP